MSLYGKREEVTIGVERASLDDLPFYAVSSAKLVLLSVATFGIYELYWFYRNWRCVKERTGRDIWPVWRGIFSPIFCYGMASAIRSAAGSVQLVPRLQPGPLALAYVGILALETLPDPWWSLSMLSFLPLLPMAAEIRSVHERLRPGLDSTVGWSPRSVAALVVGGTLAGLAVLGSLGPPTHVQLGSEVPERFERALRDAGIVEPGERIDFLYSTAYFSITRDGNLLTDRRIIRYEEVEGERVLHEAGFAEVESLVPEYSADFLEDTTVHVIARGDEPFVLFLSSEEDRDRQFVEAALSRIPPEARPRDEEAAP